MTTKPDEPDNTVQETVAVFNIDFNKNHLNILFGDDRSVTMELESEDETAVCDMVLSDPNFWAQFLGSFSAALKKSM